MNFAANKYFKILAETDTLILGHEFEYAALINKRSKKEVFYHGFGYGDPCCGLIGPDNNWCAVGGNELVVWTKDGDARIFIEIEISWIEDMRLKSNYEFEFLVDPWSEYGVVWRMNVQTMEMQKIKDFDLRDQPNSEDVRW
ncbi:hypothetical protein [Mucilaginibacter ginsenosidivorax]|uniref:Uncharacterized protein n=1 Tax=Mucilaginibacter ginsenosidivorax TaxID=862126 RepID=A0A5B8WAW7_9SPHI|nr:hypothetical protein [Mucilaginibacter ginsenosidivorax]QEC79902.1 hypothetical protein FSB76_29545 [Mucilaginibacter ginsenosidivorax]